jgi:hypothetical protein
MTSTTTDDRFNADLSEAVAALTAAQSDERRRLAYVSAQKLAQAWPRHPNEILAGLRDACRELEGNIRAGIDAGRDAINNVAELGSWSPISLDLWLSGIAETPTPTLGMARSDAVRLIYPGREHAILGETESGKTWLALGCVAAELLAGHRVVYIHYEEGDPASTVERLLLRGVSAAAISQGLCFVAPSEPVAPEWVSALCDPPPSLVVHDGVNEAMSLMDMGISDVDGAAEFRRLLVTPFRAVGAATVACDHLPMHHDSSRTAAYGSVHKGNALDGARIMLENVEPFGRAMRGVSRVLVTKDRPGYLRAHGRPTGTPAKTFVGTLIVDAAGSDFAMVFVAPTDTDEPRTAAGDDLADIVFNVIAAMPGHRVTSERALLAEVRKAGHKFRSAGVRAAVDDLVAAGRLIGVSGRHGANTYTTTS